jgi:hypothetical protein
MLDPVVGYLIVLSVALMFATASVHKLRDLRAFGESVAQYRVIPAGCARLAAVTISLLEVAVVVMSLWPRGRHVANILAICLLTGYALAMALNLARGHVELSCGCGAADEPRAISLWMILRNLLLVSALAVSMLPWSARTLAGTDLLTIAAGVTAASAFYLIFDRLFGEIAPVRITFRGAS